ncbi:MAG: Uma2 family endonuclease [Cytophagia bacterium]|nr:MAG: Uma2 family endonuclease [Cytophagales bacterium]TAG15604.1 MAG: Uma2 family endonuclease [Cytophagales bacterium]TAG37634.1 MAG: Uma2 family endonuclease [Cytophagia bacterium]TAG84802.1 MAG: Uma2 family endonuclease [Cytophagales bacterium]
MELVTETVVESPGLSQYELERHKPMPTLVHGAIQANLTIQIAVNYPNQFRIASEVTLATKPDGSTPDLVLYPAGELDFKNNPTRRIDAPLLTIEIQSPSQSTKDMVDKLEPYFYFGVKSCWVVVPELRAILVYDNPFTYAFFHDKEIVKDAVMNIEIDLQKVFA